MTGSLAYADSACSWFEVSFVDQLGVGMRVSLPECWGTAFEHTAPVRSFPSFKGQRNFPGWWWLVTTGEHVGYESWLERDHVMMLDFDRDVVGVAAQPFRLHWLDGRRERSHVPDFFARRMDGTGVVIDVRADDRIAPVDAEAFAATESACRAAGWVFRRVGELAPVLAGNVRWLSRYRHPRYAPGRHVAGIGDIGDRACEVFADPVPLSEGASLIGDSLVVLPVLFHLLWRRVLVTELELALLSGDSLISVGASQ
jgi:hypothetical protein